MNHLSVDAHRIEPKQWFDSLPLISNAVFAHHSVENVECSLIFCDNAYSAELNQQYRNIDGPTDVLSFCADEGDQIPGSGEEDIHYLGDIVISLEYVEENAKHFSVPVEQEIRRVVIHGLLHLLGHTHASNDDSEPMLQLQEKIVQTGEPLF